MTIATTRCRECSGEGGDCRSCHGAGRHPVPLSIVLADTEGGTDGS